MTINIPEGMVAEHCQQCRYYGNLVIGGSITPNLCRRYPRAVQKNQKDWCAEFAPAHSPTPYPAIGREEIAVELASHFAARPWCEMAPNRAELRRLFRQNPTPTNPFDTNEPTKDDCRDAADAILALLQTKGEGKG